MAGNSPEQLCQRCNGSGYVWTEKAMMVRGSDGTMHTETVAVQEPCGCK